MAIRKAENIGQAVLLCKEQKGADRIQRKPVFDRTRFRRVEFADVRKALAWLAQDCRFSVGDSIYEQVGGLPQGSSFSPILARLYLDDAHRSFEKNPKTFMAEVLDFKRRIGKKTRDWLSIFFHVDDSIWNSQRICAACLTLCAFRVWPADVGVTVESTEQTFEFLHTQITMGEKPTDPPISIDYRVKNADFAQGRTASPGFSLFPPFVHGLSQFEHLRRCAGAHLLLVAGCYQNSFTAAHATRVCSVAMEALRLGWPRRAITRLLFGFKHGEWTATTKLCRTAAVWIRRHRTCCRTVRRTKHQATSNDLATVMFEHLVHFTTPRAQNPNPRPMA